MAQFVLRQLAKMIVLTLLLLPGCGLQGTAEALPSVQGAWIAVDPLAQNVVGIEFEDSGKAIVTSLEGVVEPKSVTFDYSVLEGTRIRFDLPASGTSETVTFERNLDRLTLTSSGGVRNLTGEFRAAGPEATRNLHDRSFWEGLHADRCLADAQDCMARSEPEKARELLLQIPEGTRSYSTAQQLLNELSAVSDTEMELAKEHFSSFCATCHGQAGKGDGPAAVVLDPKPRDWTDRQWQNSVTDEHIATVIRDGGAAVGLSPLMPPNPMYSDNPEVIAALVEIVRASAN